MIALPDDKTPDLHLDDVCAEIGRLIESRRQAALLEMQVVLRRQLTNAKTLKALATSMLWLCVLSTVTHGLLLVAQPRLSALDYATQVFWVVVTLYMMRVVRQHQDAIVTLENACRTK